MDRCPVCDAPVRHGAKFCTSCGSRILEPSPYANAATDWVTAAVPEPVETTWSAASSEATETWPSAPAAEDSGWAAPAATWPEPDHARHDLAPASHAATPMASPEAAVVVEEASVEPAAERIETVLAAPALVETALVARAEDGDAALARAGDLLRELRDLLPRIAGGGIDPLRLAAVLEAGIVADRARWAGLRAVMEQARDNPRDVETVLKLSQQVDEVIALVDRHEAVTAAVERAVVQLRGGNA